MPHRTALKGFAVAGNVDSMSIHKLKSGCRACRVHTLEVLGCPNSSTPASKVPSYAASITWVGTAVFMGTPETGANPYQTSVGLEVSNVQSYRGPVTSNVQLLHPHLIPNSSFFPPSPRASLGPHL